MSAEWFAAVGTVGAVLVALGQIGYEHRARGDREHRAQAEHMSAWYSGTLDAAEPFDKPTVQLTLLNRSDEPVYDVVATVVFIQGAGPRIGEDWSPLLQKTGVAWPEFVGTSLTVRSVRAVLSVLPPGQRTVRVLHPGGGRVSRLGAEIAFTDRRGTHWIRRSNGDLVELKKTAIDRYGIPSPLDYQTCESA